MYENLQYEMRKRNVTRSEIEQLLGVHRNTVANKFTGKTQFTVNEAIQIQKQFFGDLSLTYLFLDMKDEN